MPEHLELTKPSNYVPAAIFAHNSPIHPLSANDADALRVDFYDVHLGFLKMVAPRKGP
jgi:hypothetical protein